MIKFSGINEFEITQIKKRFPSFGQTRERTIFTFLPLMINEKIKWLEKVKILEVFIFKHKKSIGSKNNELVFFWKKIEFL